MRKSFTWGYYDDAGRKCKTCMIYKPYTEFHKHKGCPNGYNTICKECRKEVSKEAWANKPIEQRLLERCRWRAYEKVIEFSITLSDIAIPNVCPVFGTKFVLNDPDLAPSLDRTDNTLGYIPGNVVVMSNRANRIKSDATVQEVESLLKYMKRVKFKEM